MMSGKTEQVREKCAAEEDLMMLMNDGLSDSEIAREFRIDPTPRDTEDTLVPVDLIGIIRKLRNEIEGIPRA